MLALDASEAYRIFRYRYEFPSERYSTGIA
jgi:hypothetical protein